MEVKEPVDHEQMHQTFRAMCDLFKKHNDEERTRLLATLAVLFDVDTEVFHRLSRVEVSKP